MIDMSEYVFFLWDHYGNLLEWAPRNEQHEKVWLVVALDVQASDVKAGGAERCSLVHRSNGKRTTVDTNYWNWEFV